MKKQQKKQIKQIQNQAQDGRSMVEMLGVLALIGVLSVGSLSGYEYATASYRAGQIRDALLAAKKLASINTSDSHMNEVRRLLKSSLSSYGVEVPEGQYPYQVLLTGVAPRTCSHLWEMKKVLSSFSIEMTSPASKNDCQSGNASVETVAMSFEFNALDNQVSGGSSSSPSSGCTGNDDCGRGWHCQNGDCVQLQPETTKTSYIPEVTSATPSSTKVTPTTSSSTNVSTEASTTYTPTTEATTTYTWFVSTTTPDCGEHGTWNEWGGYCECEYREMGMNIGGYAGPNCSKTVDEYCHGHAFCGWDSYNQKCMCDSGWCGQDCSQPSVENSEKCSGHGGWDERESKCRCDLGWKGTDCNTAACSGHGDWSDYDGGYCYSCKDGYGGPNCETENKCNRDHGLWYNNLDGSGYCKCIGDYGGSDCGTADARHNLCHDNGYWYSGKCSCYSGWKGTDCNTAACSGHGWWSDNDGGYCYQCTGGFGGPDCATPDMCNKGTWHNKSDGSGYCDCNYRWYGDKCDKCNGQGTAYNADTGKCTCKAGYSGDDCEIKN